MEDAEQASEKEKTEWHCPFSIGKRQRPEFGSNLQNGWWALPLLQLLGCIDLVIAVLDFKPGLPFAFEIVYLVFEVISFLLLCAMMQTVFKAFFWFEWGTLRRFLIVVWCLSVPISLAAVAKSIASLVLETQNRLPVVLNYVSIALAALLFFYDIALSLFDFPAKFGHDVVVSFPGWDTIFRREALKELRSYCRCF